MYHINWELIERIPHVFDVSFRKWGMVVSKTSPSVKAWGSNKGISVYDLVLTCNWLHISIAEFISTEKKPLIKKKNEYLISKESFQEITFHNEMIGEIYGNGGMLGISKTKFAEQMGVGPVYIDKWIRDPKQIRLSKFIKMMNLFELNICQFIEDPNKVIELPVWDKDKSSPKFNRMIEQLSLENKNYQEENGKLKLINDRKEKIIVSMSSSIEKLRGENDNYKKIIEKRSLYDDYDYSGVLAEGNIPYRKGLGRFKFHYELLRSLPDIFDVQRVKFMRMFSLGQDFLYKDKYNIYIDKLISICNFLRVSVFHFFVPEQDEFMIRNRYFYEIAEIRFIPIKSKLDNLKFVFGKDSVFDIPIDEVDVIKSYMAFNSWAKKDGSSTFKIITMMSVCNEFNISPSILIEDENRKNMPLYPISKNESLILNCIELKKKVVELAEENKKLKLILKEKI